MIAPYQAIVFQSRVREIRNADSREEILRDNAWRQVALLRRFKFSYPRLKLVVASESVTHGLDAGRPRATIAPLAIDIQEEVFKPYLIAAREHQLYIAFSFQERNPDFPETFFHTGVIIGPEGKVLLRQPMLNASLAQSGGSGVFTRWEALYGPDSLFPVIDTPIGKLGVIVGGDIYQPEVARALTLRGCEVLIHPTGSRDTEASRMVQAFRQSAAYYNQAYLLCANIGTYQHKAYGTPPPETDEALVEALHSVSTWGESEFCGRSQIVDYSGRVLALCQQAGEAATGAVVDIERLRYERQRRSLLRRLNGAALAREYGAFPGAPNDSEQLPDPRSARKAAAETLRQRRILLESEAYR